MNKFERKSLVKFSFDNLYNWNRVEPNMTSIISLCLFHFYTAKNCPSLSHLSIHLALKGFFLIQVLQEYTWWSAMKGEARKMEFSWFKLRCEVEKITHFSIIPMCSSYKGFWSLEFVDLGREFYVSFLTDEWKNRLSDTGS